MTRVRHAKVNDKGWSHTTYNFYPKETKQTTLQNLKPHESEVCILSSLFSSDLEVVPNGFLRVSVIVKMNLFKLSYGRSLCVCLICGKKNNNVGKSQDFRLIFK